MKSWPNVKLCKDGFRSNIFQNHMSSLYCSYIIIIGPNSHEKSTKNELRQSGVNFDYGSKSVIYPPWFIFTSPPIGGGRGIVMPMSVCLFVCVCVCPCFRKISKCNISAISQPIIMKLGIHITYGYTVTDKYFQNFRSKVKVIGHRNVFPRNFNM